MVEYNVKSYCRSGLTNRHKCFYCWKKLTLPYWPFLPFYVRQHSIRPQKEKMLFRSRFSVALSCSVHQRLLSKSFVLTAPDFLEDDFKTTEHWNIGGYWTMKWCWICFWWSWSTNVLEGWAPTGASSEVGKIESCCSTKSHCSYHTEVQQILDVQPFLKGPLVVWYADWYTIFLQPTFIVKSADYTGCFFSLGLPSKVLSTEKLI